MSQSQDDLAEAIANLAQKKQVISEEALKAKQEFDQKKDELGYGLDLGNKKFMKQLGIVDEFNTSVKLLASIFQSSNFDELALFIASPTRVLLVNFFIGILRGLGFALGFLIVFVFLAYLIKLSLPPDYAKHMVILGTYFLQQVGLH
jgi:hypothetical protein